MEAALLHACDVNYQLADLAFFGASQRGEAVETGAIHLSCCGLPARDFNKVRLKRTDDVPAALARGEAFFGERELPWHVELRADQEAGAAPALEAAGFRRTALVPGMVLSPIRGGKREVPKLVIREVRDAEGLERFQHTAFEGFGLPGRLGPLFLTPALMALPGVTLFLGELDGEPAATSLLLRTPGVAGVYWVATLAAHRGRGLGEALTWAAVRAGAEAGDPVASLQASEMGAPVYTRMGFETPLHYLRYARP